ncbi:hypothetical protein [Paraferrimonas haliotis]|uniref:Lipoprotein n=1 Tax=Paraferrimonas haliotis TaxID=2013866 RepID=A0AA37WW94_9GAMM|nr:hypothetical protein [Paraferrimonas haliotis]GLS83177.1 hypothetical protein GCM10007894_11540 [Paraferrimonas haliotis]
MKFEDRPVPANLTEVQVQTAIEKASFKRGWIMQLKAPGMMEAKLTLRTHEVTVDIPFTTEGYAIRYVDSVNMNYKNGKIHTKYNTWVTNLDRDIQESLYDVYRQQAGKSEQ